VILDTSVPFGSVSYTNEALAAKTANVNALYAGMDDNSNFALATAYKQAGIKLKAVAFPTGYEPSAIHSAAWTYLQGDYFDSEFRPFALPNAGTKQMQAALEKYGHFTKTQFPTIEQYEAWVGADLMIKGLQLAGTTRRQRGLSKPCATSRRTTRTVFCRAPSTIRRSSVATSRRVAVASCRQSRTGSFPFRANPSVAPTFRARTPPTATPAERNRPAGQSG
jgi:hypothetical protein